MENTAFSVSLAVKNLKDSKEFYEKLGFTMFGGQVEHNWAMMRSGDVVIGLFQGMFDKNILTFNPGWNNNAENVDQFTDIRDIQEDLKSKGIKMIQEVEEETKGPGSFVIEDPDGNPILFDQHR
jgi:catechol 2,3-dioxygenase-like lactoylglutathione lyase family enzyme